jgi:hypothetical protein
MGLYPKYRCVFNSGRETENQFFFNRGYHALIVKPSIRIPSLVVAVAWVTSYIQHEE